MDPRQVRQQPPTGGFEVVTAVIGGLVVAVAAVTYAGAWLAATVVGGWVSGGIGDWLTVTGRLASTPGDPTAAWAGHAGGLPGPVLYWGCTLAVAAAVGALLAAGVWAWKRWSSPSRSRFGVPTDARVARPRDRSAGCSEIAGGDHLGD